MSLGGDDPHVLHANRAAALAAAGEHDEAIAAADAALALDPAYVKAHYRKANALVELSRHAEARAACKLALSLPGMADAAKQQLEALVAKCDDATPAPPPTSPPRLSAEERKAAADAATAALADEMASLRAKTLADAREREAEQAKSMAALAESLAAESAGRREEQAQRRKQLSEEAAAVSERTVASRAAVAARLAGAIGGGAVDVGDDGEPPARPAASLAAGAAQQAKTRVDEWRTSSMVRTLTAPRVPSDFLKQYALLRKDPVGLYEYVRLIPSATLRDIFKPEVSDQVLVAVADALASQMPTAEASWAIEWLEALTTVGRFDMTVLMLDKKARAALVRMFDAIAVTKDGPTLAKLRKAYLGKE